MRHPIRMPFPIPARLAPVAMLLVGAAALVTPATAALVSRATPMAQFVPGELLVIRRPGSAVETRADGALAARGARAQAVLARHGLDRWQPIGGAGGRRGGDWVKLVSERPDFDPRAAAAELMASGEVVAAAPNLMLRLYPTLPNDPYLSSFEYWCFDPGDADIQLTDAWDVETGDSSVTIGIMDTGVDRTHPDLAAQIWRNEREIPGNGVDDDGDGYVDDVNGWDFGDGDNDPNPEAIFEPELGIDIGFHGTFVAGLAAAATDNNEGIAGTAWHCRIAPLKVTDSSGDITLEATAAAFRYAGAHHLSVLNMSLGTADTTARAFFQTMVDSVTDQGVVCVAAAGNDGTADPSFPAACDHVLSVAATDPYDQRATFSNFGPTVDVAAPGQTMWSALCTNYEIDELSQIYYIFLFGWDGQDPYISGDGTSFACPLASGVCALVRSRWPNLTPAQVIQHVIATGDAVTYDEPIGRKLNALRAVREQPLAVDGTAAAGVARAAAWPNPFRSLETIGLALPHEGVMHVTVFDAGGRQVRTLAAGTFAAGAHRLTWDGRSDAGAAEPPGLYFVQILAPGLVRTLRIAHVE